MGLPKIELTTAEAAALSELSEKRIRKEVEHGLLGTASPPRFSFSDLVYFSALGRSRLLAEVGLDIREELLGKLQEALRITPIPDVELSPGYEYLRVGKIVEGLLPKVTRFFGWRSQLVTDEKILGGETVFPDTRLSVRHIGAMAERGERVEAILEDYPYLTSEDVELARIFVQANPLVGRPRENRQTAAR